jgi:hypothetical protein
MHVDKAKLPKGLSYPVKTGMIASALAEAGVTLDCSVNYYNNLQTGFTAHFWPPNPNVGFERLYLTIGAVSSDEERRFDGACMNPYCLRLSRGFVACLPFRWSRRSDGKSRYFTGTSLGKSAPGNRDHLHGPLIRTLDSQPRALKSVSVTLLLESIEFQYFMPAGSAIGREVPKTSIPNISQINLHNVLNYDTLR